MPPACQEEEEKVQYTVVENQREEEETVPFRTHPSTSHGEGKKITMMMMISGIPIEIIC